MYFFLATIEALFSELAEDNEVMRERTLKMLAMKLRTLETGVMKPEVKELLIKECKKILQASFKKIITYYELTKSVWFQ